MPPSHKEWTPSAGQAEAVRFLVSTASAALLADPGAGKTSITLEAFCTLQSENALGPNSANNLQMLVIAPLRVCQLTWRQEAAKWTQFRHLRIGLLHGSKKDQVLKDRDQYDILLVNYEGLDWLCAKFKHRQLPFDIICADELTKLKAHDGKRARQLRKQTERTPVKWGLTGTPIPNGYMDLFGQFLWLDGGRALGKFITHFRDMYFKVGFTGFDYTLQAGAAERIEARIADSVFRLSYEAMPLHDIPIRADMPREVREAYREFKREMILELGDTTITAANAAVVQGRLAQMANGAIYTTPDRSEYAVIHDLKLDMLEELTESLNGQQLLIAYEFGHDLERIQARFPGIATMSGASEKEAMRLEQGWNSGEIREMAVHPASAGHGLNLQLSSAKFICWFGATWNLEHWDQLIRRLRRQGSSASQITNYILVVNGTVDELKLDALSAKDTTQARLLQSLADHLEDGDVSRNRNSSVEPRPSGDDRLREAFGQPDEGREGCDRGPPGGEGEAGGEDRHASSADHSGLYQCSPLERAGLRGDDVAAAVHGHGAPAGGGASAAPRLYRDEEGGRGPRLHSDPERPVAARSHSASTEGDDDVTMGFKRLPAGPADAAPAANEAPATRPAPKGWPVKGAQPAAAPASQEAQREAIRARVTPQAQPAAEAPQQAEPPAARSFFSRGVQAQLQPQADAVHETADPYTVGIQNEPQPEPAAELAKPAARRAPRTARDKTPEESADIGRETTTAPALDTVRYPVQISLEGLPPHAVKAALVAIANAL